MSQADARTKNKSYISLNHLILDIEEQGTEFFFKGSLNLIQYRTYESVDIDKCGDFLHFKHEICMGNVHKYPNQYLYVISI